MELADLTRHRCRDPRCRRPFAIVYPWATGEPGLLALACPHCGMTHMMMAPSGSLRDLEAAYVLPLQGMGNRLTA